jgi:methylated-DNA-protein-cysteine methyltransferase-like protein
MKSASRSRTPVLHASYLRIWRTVSRIPRGRVSSYGVVAKTSGFPHQPRLVGYALHNIPPGVEIPWQRVINARGMISLPGESGAQQKRLLEKEGVLFVSGKVNMKVFGWSGRKTTKSGNRNSTPPGAIA